MNKTTVRFSTRLESIVTGARLSLIHILPSSTQYQVAVPIGKFEKVILIQLPEGAGLVPQLTEIDGEEMCIRDRSNLDPG